MCENLSKIVFNAFLSCPSPTGCPGEVAGCLQEARGRVHHLPHVHHREGQPTTQAFGFATKLTKSQSCKSPTS